MLSTSAASLRRLTQLPVALKPRNPSGLLTRRPQVRAVMISFLDVQAKTPYQAG